VADPEHVERLKRSVAEWNEWRLKLAREHAKLFRELPDDPSDTEWADLDRHKVRPDLSGADLFEANLSDANLGHTYLSGANLSGAVLLRADLFEANLSGAVLAAADLRFAHLRYADLSGANLSGAVLLHAVLSDATLNRANLTAVKLYETIFGDVDLSNGCADYSEVPAAVSQQSLHHGNQRTIYPLDRSACF
jgi:uncharacterized protein YjbI with pentapeptide repeats